MLQDFPATIVWWFCAVAHLTGNIGCKICALWQQCFFSRSI